MGELFIFSVEKGTPPLTYDWRNIFEPTVGGVETTTLFYNPNKSFTFVKI